MKKELLKELQLQVGGSHYPSINPEMQEAFARLVIAKCIDAVKQTKKGHAHTTHDLDNVESTIQRSIDSITETFGIPNEYYTPPKSSKITQSL